MTASNTFENDLAKLIFNNTDITGLGDAGGLRGSVTAGSLYIALHTADPGEAGNQSTNEVSYTGYGRVAVARTSGGFTVSGSNVSNTAAVTFGACTAGSATATHFSIGDTSTGATKILASGALASSLAISAGITPSFAIGELDCDID